MVQMPTRWGMRCLMNQARRGFREAKGFEVRYWAPSELRRVFSQAVGQSELSVDCFFGIGWQPADLHLMPPLFKLAVLASEALRKVSTFIPLTVFADSVYVNSAKPKMQSSM